MRLKRRALLFAALISVAIMGDIAAQCSKTWVKKQCIPKIAPFIHNGQMNTTPLKEGGKMETTLTFYSGQDYRILICAEETLENISFVVSDLNGAIIFDSKEHNNTDVWDFKVKTTTDLKVAVSVGRNEGGNGTATGCVSVLVGFKSK
ncbi:MAG: hypothetical protein NT084_13710 [Bacteroidetes bacterium]|jgi:hypothetical protein|nr:hypothetical protein [Bacteroidota bacterium]